MDPKISGEDRWLNNRRFGEILIDDGKLDAAGLDQALQLQKREPSLRIGELLVRAGLIRHADVAQTLSRQFSLPVAAARDYPEFPVLDDLISIRYVREARALPLAETPECLTLAMVVPQAAEIINAFRVLSGRKIEVRIAVQDDFDVAFERLYGGGRTAMGQIIDDIESVSVHDFDADDIQHLKDQASEAPVIRLVGLIIRKALDARASDIHIEPFENRLKVRYRIDGVLEEGESPPQNLTAAVISRIKIMAKLNIAERRLPQDGRIMLRVQGKELDLRVSTIPTAHGESVVMRLLDRETVVFDFERLGFTDAFLPQFQHVLQQPHGILLVTGPTGSGKTTTLYTALSKLNTSDVKIITVEDPVEYQIEGINQIQAKPQIGLDFANALRSIVRQDPDIIMIGEMRDLETAKIAIQSALTGHLVLSTLHTNNAAGGITRLLDMGVEDYLLTSTVNGILAQRLVRRLEPVHAERYPASPEEIEKFGLRRYQPQGDIYLYRPRGSDLAPTGYLGRTTIMEFLVMDDELRRAVMRHAGMGELEQLARQAGMRTMYEDGIAKALAGLTTIEEVLRVTEDA